MASIDTHLLTADEFRLLPDQNQPLELVRGSVVMMSNPGARHGHVCHCIGRILGNFISQHDLGFIFSNDAGVITERNPDTVRGPDIAYYSFQRIPKDPGPPEGYPDVVPELVFEVLSPSDSWKKVLRKITEFIEAGVSIACVADPQSRQITVFYSDRSSEKLTCDDVISFPDLLPGFSSHVRDLFGIV